MKDNNLFSIYFEEGFKYELAALRSSNSLVKGTTAFGGEWSDDVYEGELLNGTPHGYGQTENECM